MTLGVDLGVVLGTTYVEGFVEGCRAQIGEGNPEGEMLLQMRQSVTMLSWQGHHKRLRLTHQVGGATI